MNYHPTCNFLRIVWDLAFLQIIINYSASSEKHETVMFWLSSDLWFPFNLAVVLCSSLAELRTSGSEAPFPLIKSHSPSTLNSSVLIAAYLHSLFLSLPFSTPQTTPVLKYIPSSFLCLVSCVATVGAHKRNANQIQTAVKMDTFWPHPVFIITNYIYAIK